MAFERSYDWKQKPSVSKGAGGFEPLRDLGQIVQDLNLLYRVGGQMAAVQIGEYLLDHVIVDITPSPGASFKGSERLRELFAREDLKVSYTYLWTAIAIAEQARLLPPGALRGLTTSHQRALLPLKDRAAKLRLAEIAREGGLSKRELSMLVRQELGGRPGRGRPPIPSFVKGLRKVRSGAREAVHARIDDPMFQRLGEDDILELLEALERDIERLRTVQRRLRMELEGQDPP